MAEKYCVHFWVAENIMLGQIDSCLVRGERMQHRVYNNWHQTNEVRLW